jgi:hypothetical protein
LPDRILSFIFTFHAVYASGGYSRDYSLLTRRLLIQVALNGINWALIKYIWNFDLDKRESIEELRKRYPNVEFLIFRHSQDPDKYLEKLEVKHFYDN